MRTLSIILLSLFLFSCGETEKKVANINYECQTNVNGEVDCTFINDGNGEGSICISLTYKRKLKTGDYAKGMLESRSITNKNRICSGIVKPNDVVQRTYKTTFESEKDGSFKPSDFCWTFNSNVYEKKIDWQDACELTIKVLSKN